MGLPRSHMRVLDDKYVFDIYYREMGSAGSTPKIQKRLTKEGVRNNKGKEISEAAVWQGIKRYWVRNYDKEDIEGIVQKYYIDLGIKPLTHDEFLAETSRFARTVFAPKQYENWIRRHKDLPYYDGNEYYEQE